MRSLLRFKILLVVFGYGWGLPKVSLDGMDSSIQGKSISQNQPFHNLKGLRIAHGMEFSVIEKRSKVSSPTINVTFSDGYMDTIVSWKHYSNKEQKRSIKNDKDCNYLGHLLHEKGACVAMTGCVGMEDVVFTIMSEHATDSFHFVWTKKGEIHTVDLDPVVDLYQNDDLQRTMSQMRSINEDVCLYQKPPSTLELKVKIAYDELFYDSVDRDVSKAWKNIKRVFVHVQAAFCHASLGTKIHINYADTVILINDLRDEFNFEEDYSNNVIGPIIKPLTKDEMEKDSSLNLMVYLTNNVGSGVAFGQPCGSLESRFSINQCGSTDDVYGMLTCVAVLRHETGHNIGMPHISDNGIKNHPQDWDCGAGIEDLGSGDIMGGNSRMEWSPCSVMAFRKYYTQLIATNNWCMEEYPSACTPEASEEDIDYFQIIDGISKTNKALELIDDNLVFSVNEKKETQFWYFHLANPGDEYGLILGKNSQRAFDIFTSTCENDICKVGTWGIHNGDNQLWKKVGDDLISKWNDAKFVVSEKFSASVYTGQEQIDGGDIFIDETTTPIFNPPFEECSDGASEKFPKGKFTIRNKENGLFLSIVDGTLAFTEVKGTNSDWFLQDSNEIWDAVVSSIGKVLDLFLSQCDTDSCPVGLYDSHEGFNQKWRRSGDKIIAALPGYLAQDNSGNLVAISSTSDDNKDWVKLEIDCHSGQGNEFGACFDCLEGQIVVDDQCLSCPDGQTNVDGQCASCPYGQGIINGICDICPEGQIIANGRCESCPNGQIFKETPMIGPSDVGGQCPSPTYKYTEGGVDNCCCDNGCCWSKCGFSTPPVDCIQGIPDSLWIYSQELGFSKAFTRQCESCPNGQIVVNGVCQESNCKDKKSTKKCKKLKKKGKCSKKKVWKKCKKTCEKC